MSVNNRIKKRRLELNFSQKKLAGLAGVSTGNMSDIESGKCMPSSSAAISLARALHCSIDWLLTGKEFSETTSAISPEDAQHLSLYHMLPPEERSEIDYLINYKLERLKGDSKKMETLSSSAQKKIS